MASINHFESKADAMRYLSLVEPTVPLISLCGQSPREPLSYSDYLGWKKANGIFDYDYRKVYSPGGSNPRETVVQTAEQFLASRKRVITTLMSEV
jgi:hypothetical protein